jgi:hypothetical protein
MKKVFFSGILLGVSIFGFFGIAGTARADMYTYEYTLQTYAEANPISNLLIQLSDFTTVGNISTSVSTATNSTGTFTPATLTGLPFASMYGINFTIPGSTSHAFSIEFKTTNAPVWGNFFANDVNSQGYAFNNRDLGFYIPRPDNGGVGVPAINWIGSITNIDGNSVGAGGSLINSDSPLYAVGDRWYYQANDAIGGGDYSDFGWVEFSWKISSSPVPEPASMLLFASGLAAWAGVRRMRKK